MAVTLIGLPQALAKLAAVEAAGLEGAEAAKLTLAAEVEAAATALVPVLTGETQASIHITPEGVEAGGAAVFLEFGTVNMAAEPFMRPAADMADGETAAEVAAVPIRRLA